MYMTRREFLLASGAAAVTTAAGLVLPEWYEHVRNWCDQHESPLLEPGVSIQKPPVATLYEYDHQLYSAIPHWYLEDEMSESPPVPTWREYIESGAAFYDGDLPVTQEGLRRYLIEGLELDPWDKDVRRAKLDDPISTNPTALEVWYEYWRFDDPAQSDAYYYLNRIPFPEDAEGQRVVGGLEFERDGGSLGDYTGVRVADNVSLSLLPHVLARCGYPTEIKIL